MQAPVPEKMSPGPHPWVPQGEFDNSKYIIYSAYKKELPGATGIELLLDCDWVLKLKESEIHEFRKAKQRIIGNTTG